MSDPKKASSFVFLLCLTLVTFMACTPSTSEPEVQQVTRPALTATATTSSYPAPSAQNVESSYPGPTVTRAAERPTHGPSPTFPPSATPRPLPTSIPTPRVTPIPTAVPPIIPTLQTGDDTPFVVVFEEEGILKITDGSGDNRMTLIDPALRSLFLPFDVPIREWLSVHPNGQALAVALVPDSASAEEQEPCTLSSIYLLDLEVGSLEVLVENATEPAWSPDGNSLAYRSAKTSGLWILDVKAKTSVELYAVAEGHCATRFSWSPDSKHLVFLDRVFRQSSVIMTVQVDQPATARELIAPSPYLAYFPQWSPTGDRISFVSSLGDHEGPTLPYNLWLVGMDGRNVQQLTRNLDVLAGGEPSWSPDGSWIAFGATPYYEEAEPPVDLWLTAVSGTTLKRITANAGDSANETQATWSPDGEQILFLRDMGAVERYSLRSGVREDLSIHTSNYKVARSRAGD